MWPLPCLGGISTWQRLVSDSTNDYQVKLAVQARHELPGLRVAMHPAQHVPRGHRDVVLHEPDGDAVLLIDLLVVGLEVIPSVVFEGLGPDGENAFEFRLADVHG